MKNRLRKWQISCTPIDFWWFLFHRWCLTFSHSMFLFLYDFRDETKKSFGQWRLARLVIEKRRKSECRKKYRRYSFFSSVILPENRLEIIGNELFMPKKFAFSSVWSVRLTWWSFNLKQNKKLSVFIFVFVLDRCFVDWRKSRFDFTFLLLINDKSSGKSSKSICQYWWRRWKNASRFNTCRFFSSCVIWNQSAFDFT